jgi:CheY-specific phosphatase CheX
VVIDLAAERDARRATRDGRRATRQEMIQNPRRRLEALSEAACRELFSAYGVRLEQRPSHGARCDLAVTSIVGFTGDGISGACVLGSTVAPVIASMPSGGDPHDWIGELASQLAGRIKAKLIALGVTVYIDTPIVMRGTRVSSASAIELSPPHATDEAVLLCVEVETTPGFRPSEPGESLPAGEALFF